MSDTVRTGGDPAALRWGSLRPYFSVVVLEYTGDRAGRACATIDGVLRDAGGRQRVVVVAEGAARSGAESLAGSGVDEVAAFVRRTDEPPNWSTTGSGYVDTRHFLTVTARRGRLLAVHTDETLQRRLQRWLAGAGAAEFRRIPAPVLEGVLLPGEAKGLWLRGTHTRRASRPDSKSISGRRLQDALNAFEDPSFALASARVAMPAGNGRAALSGTVGTTPRKSLVWLRQSAGWPDYLATTAELLATVEAALAEGPPTEPAYSILARQVDDLSSVYGAFELSTLAAEDLPATPGTGDELRAAAAVLQQAELAVHGEPDSAGFRVEAGVRGETVRLRARLASGAGGADLVFDAEGDTGPESLWDALRCTELLTVHYRSGHTFTDGRVWRRNTRAVPFPNWMFEDFTGHDVGTEKPRLKHPQDVHDAIGENGDASLFGWVARQFRAGWLTCDDGSGEIADFLHVAADGTLSMIHVKAARSTARVRTAAAAAYEVVTAQAAKNLGYADPERLRARLDSAPVRRPAAWRDGVRQPSRAGFLGAVDARQPTDPVRAVIVQPHLTERAYRRLRGEAGAAAPSDDFLRLCLLDTMLNSARASAVGVGADLWVVASTR